MGRVVADRAGGPGLDDAAVVHDRNSLADVTHDGEVVGDEQVRRIGFSLKAFEQVDDLALGGDVKRRDRLVEDEQFGVVARARAIAIRCRCPPENS